MKNPTSVFIVIPTYNERGNIPTLIEALFGLGIPDLKLIVVDDASPDGTAEAVRELAVSYPIHLIERSAKRGLGTAYAEAFQAILAGRVRDWGVPDHVVQMDADWSHDPAVIPRLLDAAREHDVVIGSRYIAGGGIQNWDRSRRALSFFANHYARRVLGVPYRDLTAGFKCYRRTALEALDCGRLSSVGYNFQIETVYRAHTAGLRIAEIPITFTERKHGISKMNLGIMLESFWKVLLLRLRG
ncbi:MAG: polyprenol monophosphomannose synthase [Candidatus Niyogibacteria bacterium]|nr:polyprenol monophosphomannose synthase [Candidatus Niyogibacteria bacterium]